MKVCIKCNKKLSLSEFHKNKSHSDKHDNVCKTCKNELTKIWRANNPEKSYNKKSKERQDKWRNNHTGEHLFAMGSFNVHKRKYVMNITINEMIDMAYNTKICPICGVKLDYAPFKGKIQDNSPSLDRINNEISISLDNSWIICNSCNRTKSNRTLKEFKEYMQNAIVNLQNLTPKLSTRSIIS